MPTHLNVEIKARTRDPGATLQRLAELGARSQGEDHQVDTYFLVPAGRLKLRQGNIENFLIHYDRSDQPGPKDSHVTLYETPAADRLLEVLSTALEVLVVVNKRRQILWIENVKFHVDDITELGAFVEIEAIDRTGSLGRDALLDQCRNYMRELSIMDSDLEARSYSDLLAPDE
jgi:predicted adenylyl cyclase CyaB